MSDWREVVEKIRGGAEHVVLYSKSFDASGFAKVCEAMHKSKTVRSFHMMDTAVDNATPIAQVLPQLRVLYVARCPIGNAIAATSGSLQELHLCDTNVGTDGTKAIAKSLQQDENNNLRWLDLSKNSISDEGVEAIANALKDEKCCKLEKLNLCMSGVGKNGCVALADALRCHNKSLVWLNLAGNPNIGRDGVKALGNALKTNHTVLDYLILAHNKMDDEGARVMANALCHNGSLRVLDLRRNRIQQSGGEALADALRVHNATLTCLYLDGNEWVNATTRHEIQSHCAKHTVYSLRVPAIVANDHTLLGLWPILIAKLPTNIVYGSFQERLDPLLHAHPCK